MKQTKCLLGTATLALLMSACSQDEASSPNFDDLTNNDTSYINVKISMGGGLGTRAEADNFDGYDIGSKEEGMVNNLALVLYDDNGIPVGRGTLSQTELESNRQGSGENISDIYSGVVAVTIYPKTAAATKVVAFVNSSEVPSDQFRNLPELTTGNIGDINRGLKMTTSGYYDNNNWIEFTNLTEANLFDSAEEASRATNEQKVNIFVERLAAKVTVDNKSQENDADYVFYDLKGKSYKITFNAKKWSGTGMAKEMYLLKNKFDPSYNSWANVSSDYRSYWANGLYYTTLYDDLAANTDILSYPTAAQIIQTGNTLDGSTPQYITEHTYGNAAKYNGSFRHEMTGTNAIVVGQYTITALDGGDLNQFKGTKDGENDFYVSLRGFVDGTNTLYIYSKVDVIKLILQRNNIQGVSKTVNSAEELTDAEYLSSFSLVKAGTDSYSVNLVSGAGTLYNINSSNPISADDLTTGTLNTAHYRNGWAYFFIPIEHNITLGENEIGAYGVVRNHSYRINVLSIKGLGAPMDNDKVGEDPEDPTDPTDPETPIIPDPDDLRNAYISATLNVLSWHNVNEQDVEL